MAENGQQPLDDELNTVRRIEKLIAKLGTITSQDRVVRMVVSRLAERRAAAGQPAPGEAAS